MALLLVLYKMSRIFSSKSRLLGSANSNMLHELLREQMDLPRQPNCGKINQNCTDRSSVHDIENYSCEVFGVGEFKYAISIFNGAKELL